jgi:hypothetical protein
MITWDKKKDEWLREKRKISFEVFADLIESGDILDAVINHAYERQTIFIIKYNGYTYAVPSEYDEEDNIILKTVYPSRKYHKQYGLTS